MTRTLDILERLALGPASLPELADHCTLPTTTVHRLLISLIDRGYAVANTRGSYGIGPSVLSLAAGRSFEDLLRDASRDIIAKLSKRCRTHVHLGVFENNMVTYLLKQPYGKSRIISEENSQLEAYCSALGKVLLASLDDCSIEDYLGEGTLVALTPHTITDAGRLRAELIRVREQGWARDDREMLLDLCCIAVPLRDRNGRARAALSISRRARGIEVDTLLDLLSELHSAAQGIERKVLSGF
ncbi:IclR family transcriptional regulator [Sphingobium sp. AntQ-1]|uniref:IclR family transcriptional regulator n=1 Tax=Sphingobium sp. AntQ-1 TaxID=2930091 RepID=UPI00234E8C93|nr:IclR family transcriptional regulator [Sphingobium sp. AntQ-1]